MTPLQSAHVITALLLCFSQIVVSSNKCISFGTFATCTDTDQVATLPSTIETLVLSGGSIEIVPSYTFSHLPYLTELNIQSMDIGQINKNAFSNLPNLDLVSISESDLSVIQPGAFRGLRGLSSLDISKCTIGDVESEAFLDIDGVKDFTIKTNNISSIDYKSFNNITAIGTFQFYENNVTVVKASAFSEWRDVMTAIVNSNRFGRLECVADQSFTVAITYRFYGNYLECDCHIAWMLTSPRFKNKLLSNKCHIPSTQENLDMSIVSLSDLQCPVNPSSTEMGCPRHEETSVGFSTPTAATSTPQSPSVSSWLTTSDSVHYSSTDNTGSPAHKQPTTVMTQFTPFTTTSSDVTTGIYVTTSTEIPVSRHSTIQSSAGGLQVTFILTVMMAVVTTIN